jgi:hypothetical protein
MEWYFLKCNKKKKLNYRYMFRIQDKFSPSKAPALEYILMKLRFPSPCKLELEK